MSEKEIKEKVDAKIKQQSEELLNIISEEEQKEDERNKRLNEITDPHRKEQLDREYGVLRGIASERIKKLAKRHEKQLIQYEKKLRGINS